MAAKKRGSEKLANAGGGASREKLDALIARFANADAKIVIDGIGKKGTPWPDTFKLKIETKKAASISSVVGALVKIPGAELKPFRVFPKGIPVPVFDVLLEIKVANPVKK